MNGRFLSKCTSFYKINLMLLAKRNKKHYIYFTNCDDFPCTLTYLIRVCSLTILLLSFYLNIYRFSKMFILDPLGMFLISGMFSISENVCLLCMCVLLRWIYIIG